MTPFWLDRPTFVTGGSGLVGGWLVERLARAGADVVCLLRDWTPQSMLLSGEARRRVKLVAGDVCDAALLERVLGEYEIDTVIHLAAQTIVPIANRNPVSTFQTNIAGTWTLLEAARRSPRVRQIVVASSDKAYGDQATLPYSESTPLAGRYPYDVSKSCADLLAQSYAATYGLPVVVTRCGNFFGGGDLNWNRLVPGTIRSVLRGQRPVIRSDGQSIRDYFYVEDGAAAYMLLAERLADDGKLAGEAFNFSSENPLRAAEVVDHVLRAMDNGLRPEILGQASNEIGAQFLSAEKARRVLGWRPMFSFDAALQRTIAWYRRHIADAPAGEPASAQAGRFLPQSGQPAGEAAPCAIGAEDDNRGF
ncbi:MAG: dTDP-glucose 4,6-dehydratase 2 [Phycisphaerae bacterium]|nr:dTDP-glucose 4,6-dehydratase 2 [Phycisphaerae bacterium]